MPLHLSCRTDDALVFSSHRQRQLLLKLSSMLSRLLLYFEQFQDSTTNLLRRIEVEFFIFIIVRREQEHVLLSRQSAILSRVLTELTNYCTSVPTLPYMLLYVICRTYNAQGSINNLCES